MLPNPSVDTLPLGLCLDDDRDEPADSSCSSKGSSADEDVDEGDRLGDGWTISCRKDGSSGTDADSGIGMNGVGDCMKDGVVGCLKVVAVCMYDGVDGCMYASCIARNNGEPCLEIPACPADMAPCPAAYPDGNVAACFGIGGTGPGPIAPYEPRSKCDFDRCTAPRPCGSGGEAELMKGRRA